MEPPPCHHLGEQPSTQVASQPGRRSRSDGARKRRGRMLDLTGFVCLRQDAILAAVDHGHPTEAWRLPRVRELLKGLPGPLGNGELLVRISHGDANSMPSDAFALVAEAAKLPQRWEPGGFKEDAPADAAELMTKLSEVDAAKACGVLVWLMSTTMVYGGHGRYEDAKARDVARALISLLGPGARWWTNVSSWTFTPARGWNPVTRHTMDGVVTGVGSGVTVVVLALDDD